MSPGECSSSEAGDSASHCPALSPTQCRHRQGCCGWCRRLDRAQEWWLPLLTACVTLRKVLSASVAPCVKWVQSSIPSPVICQRFVFVNQRAAIWFLLPHLPNDQNGAPLRAGTRHGGGEHGPQQPPGRRTSGNARSLVAVSEGCHRTSSRGASPEARRSPGQTTCPAALGPPLRTWFPGQDDAPCHWPSSWTSPRSAASADELVEKPRGALPR